MATLRVKLSTLGVVFLAASLLPARAIAQGTDTALLRGAVTDTSGAAVPGAKVTLTDQERQVSTVTTTDSAGRYIFNALKPATYTLKVEVTGFKTMVIPDLLLRLGAQTDQDVTLAVGAITQTVEVTAASPLLNTVSSALGTTVSDKYILDLPLSGRGIADLSYLSAGVTEVSGAHIGMLGGTVFASNGQRYATAEFRLDGVLATRPEGGEGGTTVADYIPSVEMLQEFRLQNNNMSAEYGNNGGTIVNIVTKSGTNSFHGSGWWFAQRPGLNANDFFSNLAGIGRGKFAFDQYGGSLGGPIRKDKTFFFVDYERFRNNSPFTVVTTVPTPRQRVGDFSQTFNADGTLQQIFNPYQVTCTPLSGGGQDCERQPFPGNIINIPLDPIAAKLINLYPQPTGPGLAPSGINNFTDKLVSTNPQYNYDVRIDHDFSSSNRLVGRYSQTHTRSYTPDDFLEPSLSYSLTHDVALQDIWTISPTLLWTNRLGVNRDNYPQTVPLTVDPLSVGFPSSLVLNPWYEEKHFPSITIDGYQNLAADQCCTDTIEADTQWMIDSIVTKVRGGHSIKFGGEGRFFLNSFFQPGNTSGGFNFGQPTTMQSVFTPNFDQGNGLATLLLGFSNGGGVGELPHVANSSREGAVFVQDDWKATSRLTVNMGLRWEWTVPYTERYNHNQFSCFTCPSGIFVPASGLWPGGQIMGTTILATPANRHPQNDLNDFAPRLGLAYRLAQNTVLHGGAGVYYGMNFATNWQYGGTAWQGSANVLASLDGGITRYATMENPFPQGFALPQQGQYGPLTEWGYSNFNHASTDFQTPDIYQWNLGIQRQWGNTTLDASYVGNHSAHDAIGYNAENRNFVGRAAREKYGSAGLAQLVPNPFLYLFQGSTAIFNAPGSIYNDPTIPLLNILRPYPQFDGAFAGFPLWAGNGNYNAFQLRVERRTAHGLSFVGNYTFSKFIDNSDVGGNAWIGNLGFVGQPQDLTNLKPEKSLSGNDTPQRLAFAVIYDLPVGRGQRFGSHASRLLDAAIGGWRISNIITLQTGQPIAVNDANGLLADGYQRPNVNGKPCSGASVDAVVNGTANYFNLGAFSHAADQQPGDAPRYFSNCRVPGIHNLDTSLAKQIHITESKFLELRGEFFNALNTPRFTGPGYSFGTTGFGTIGSLANSPRAGQLGLRFVF